MSVKYLNKKNNIAGAAAVTAVALGALGCHVQRVPKN
jgi:hypothetical protein